MSQEKVLILKSVWVANIGAVAVRGDMVSIDHRVTDKWIASGYCTRDLNHPIQKTDGDLVMPQDVDRDDPRVEELEQRLALLEGKSGGKSRKAKASNPDPKPDDKP